MKRSLITNAVLCFVLCGAFCMIGKNGKEQGKKHAYCCMKVCKPSAIQQKTTGEIDSYIPVVNIWGYN